MTKWDTLMWDPPILCNRNENLEYLKNFLTVGPQLRKYDFTDLMNYRYLRIFVLFHALIVNISNG